jgi:LPPG:FO 2-phospho-L-lactate transferase
LITVIAGGTGSIKLVRGLYSIARDLTVICNVADNMWLHGLYICPDVDTMIYGLAGLLDLRRGWGIKKDSFGFLEQIVLLGEPAWFKLGDRDLATHLIRTNLLKNGKNLTEITDWMRKKYSIHAKIVPATDSPVETKIITDGGEMHIQEYWVREKAKRAVSGIKYSGIECARVNPRAIQALKRSELIIIAPANPITSIGPTLAMKSLKKNLSSEKTKIIAVSPIIGSNAVSGPAVKYMNALNLKISPLGVAEYYSEFITKFVISKSDRNLSKPISKLGIKVYETDIVMKTREDEERLASYILKKAQSV